MLTVFVILVYFELLIILPDFKCPVFPFLFRLKKVRVSPMQGFCGKYKPSAARSGDFPQNRFSGLDLAAGVKHVDTFA